MSDSTSPVASSPVSDQHKLAVFEEVLSDIEAEKQLDLEVDQAETQSISTPSFGEPAIQSPQPGQAQQQEYLSAGVRKEQAPTPVASPELPGGMQSVESEPSPEIPPEVESYLQRVESDPGQLPQEIVIAAQEHTAQQPRNLPQDVKVLPITAAQAEAGKKKNTSFSIRWLVAFSEKLAEMFKGKAVYRNE